MKQEYRKKVAMKKMDALVRRACKLRTRYEKAQGVLSHLSSLMEENTKKIVDHKNHYFSQTSFDFEKDARVENESFSEIL